MASTAMTAGQALGAEQAPSAVRIEALSKTFPGQRALDAVDLDIRRGEIHALVGQNGSGKSTLIKVLSGFHDPDPGARAWIGGEEAELGSLTEAQRASMTFIHQDLALIPTLSIRENLGLEHTGRGLKAVDARSERRRTRELLGTFGLDVDPDALVSAITPFERAVVAIARALGAVDGDVGLLVLDEPTAALGAAETQQLFATLRDVNRRGVAILYVSHFLNEVLEIADRVTVLRDGARVAVRDVQGMTEAQLVDLIVGRELDAVAPPDTDPAHADALLRVEGLSSAGLDGVSFEAHAGEVLGITGIVGSGYEAIAACLAGARPWTGGTVELGGTRHERLTPVDAAAAGLAAVPADRRGLGLIASFTIAENVTLPMQGEAWRRGRIDRRAERADVQRWIDLAGVVPPEPDRLVQELSGGNQQKVMIAKALRLEPTVLVLAEPTQAVDVGASASIRRLICDLAADGRAVVVASSDPEELEQICQRVLITRNGRIACQLRGGDITEDRIVYESQFEGEA